MIYIVDLNNKDFEPPFKLELGGFKSLNRDNPILTKITVTFQRFRSKTIRTVVMSNSLLIICSEHMS